MSGPRPPGPSAAALEAGSVSVIVPAYRAAATTLAACVQSVLDQSGDLLGEVVVVVSGVDREPRLPHDARVNVTTSPQRLSAAAARNRGARLAVGDPLVFVDADVRAPAGWLAALAAASAGGAFVVAGGVRNGTPDSLWGTAEHLVQFSELDPARLGRPVHGATCNLLVPRAAWARYGPFPEDLDGGEDTLLTLAARRDGAFRPALEAAVVHANRTAPRQVLAHQRDFGRFTARLARRAPDLPHRRLLHPGLAPVAFVARMFNVLRRARRVAPERRWVRTAPAVAALLAAWAFGLVEEGFRLWKTERPCFPRSSSSGR